MSLNGEKNRIAAIGLLIFAAGAAVGLIAGNKEIREQLKEKSNQLLDKV
ncbi:MAG TPA: hypothetical protein VED86_02375 [archaeon]|nr:hypothetical protein [archaeon]